jgi:murein DD-endopeptidase MepM/ murein hydrolase activator NlpD
LKQANKIIQRLTKGYLLIIRREDNFEEKRRFHFTGAKMLVLSSTLLLFLYAGFHYLTRSVMSVAYDRSEVELELTNKLVELSVSLDSLLAEVEQRDQFLHNIQQIANGGEGLAIAQAPPADKAAGGREVSLKEQSEADRRLRQEFEKETQSGFFAADQNKASEAITAGNKVFFTPVSGIISSEYNASIRHYGVDVVARKDEPVKAIAGGTVIMSSWTDDTGYVIAIQHDDNLVSIYKHNASLFKKAGSFVTAGEIISIIGNTGELTTGPHLHLELWQHGNPVDPKQYINF